MTSLTQINKKICNFLDRGVRNEVEDLLSCAKNSATLEEKPLYLTYCLTVSTLSAEAHGDHERRNQDESGVVGSPKFAEHLPDEKKRREGIQVLVVPIVKKGNCFGILKWRDKVRDPVVETCGEEIDSRVAPY
ncbi:hypothetical protein E2C01_040462 [Portunus trituberculatus]|uniref:Uncharacterized protein n=1 Tax=Portunus trituberculatus TaxID=210409 RepID=A0A5B7FML0_PORTR|nr:hypothetical protein [Portunus trituberculatus]